MGVRPAREGRTGRGRRGASTHGARPPAECRGFCAASRAERPPHCVRSVLRFMALCQTDLIAAQRTLGSSVLRDPRRRRESTGASRDDTTRGRGR